MDVKGDTRIANKLSATYEDPLLEFSSRKIEFKWMWISGCTQNTFSQDLTIKSVSNLPTSFALKVSAPFSVNKDSFSLKPGQEEVVRVDFDPSQRVERHSYEVKDKLLVVHREHPIVHSVDLIGLVC